MSDEPGRRHKGSHGWHHPRLKELPLRGLTWATTLLLEAAWAHRSAWRLLRLRLLLLLEEREHPVLLLLAVWAAQGSWSPSPAAEEAEVARHKGSQPLQLLPAASEQCH